MRFSVLIPARNEAAFIGGCLDSVHAAADELPGGRDDLEIVVCLNRCTDATERIARQHGARLVHDERKNLSAIRNTAARAATGDIVVTLDADSRMSPNMLCRIDRKLRTGRFIGGGVLILPERWSSGIFMTGVALLPVAAWYRISCGAFWCFRDDFQSIGGFDQTMVSVEDIDFARRLKAHGKRQGKRYGTLLRAHIRTSCRKFDRFGDWHAFRNPRWMWTLFRGRDQAAADRFWYDVER